jgi:hypothetical protein
MVLLLGMAAVAGAKPMIDLNLEQFSGAELKDQTGRWTAKPLGAATAVAGRRPGTSALQGAVQLDLPTDYVFSHGFTLEVWFQIDAKNAGRLVDRSTPGSADSFCLDTHPGDALRLITPGGTISALGVLNTGTWYHATGVYDQEQGYLGLFLNGKQVAQATGVPATTIGGTQPLTVGGDPLGGSRLAGKIASVQVYDYALSDAEILARYEGKPAPPPAAAAAAAPLCYRNGPQVDMPALLARNDVVYLSPAIYESEAMPFGNGVLSGMLWNADGLNLQLSNANNVWTERSSGRVSLTAEPGLTMSMPRAASPTPVVRLDFRQRLALYEGRIYTSCDSAAGDWQAVTTALGSDVVALHLSGKLLVPTLTLQLENIHGGAAVVTPTGAGFTEDLPAEGNFARKMALLAGADCPVQTAPLVTKGIQQTLDLTLTPKRGADGSFSLTVYVANPVVKPDADPLVEANKLLAAALAQGWEKNSAAAAASWQSYWDRSFLHLTSPSGVADYMENLWYLHLYWMASMGRGELAGKFNGGNFLVYHDLRGWGTSYWYQNTREMYWPLPAANHLDLCAGLQRLYLSNLPAHRKVAQELFGKKGLQVEETMAVDGKGDKHANSYTFLYLSTGLEVALQLYHEANFARDDQVLRTQVLPFMKEAMDFFMDYATPDAAGVLHLSPSDSRETYWRVVDGLPNLAAIREALPVLAGECRRLGLFPEMQTPWAEFGAHLAPLPSSADGLAYAPCVIPPEPPPSDNAYVNRLYGPEHTTTDFTKRFNGENSDLDFIYPFGLSGIGSPDRQKALTTYERRVFKASAGWDWTPLCAARLGLAEETERILIEHCRLTQHWSQGFWDSPAGPAFANGQVDCPYFDSPGVNATTTTEMVLQSYGGEIRVWPSTPETWSGAFRLRAETGFMVTSERRAGQTAYVEVESLFGDTCRLANPWADGTRVTCEGRTVLTSGDGLLTFPTQKGKRYLAERDFMPLAGQPFAVLKPAANQGVKYLAHATRGQSQVTPEPGQPCLGITADGLTPARVAVARNRAAAEAQMRPLIGERPPLTVTRAASLDTAGAETPVPQVLTGRYGVDDLAPKLDCVGYLLELPAAAPVTAVVWSYDRTGGRYDFTSHTAAYRGQVQRVTLEASADGQTWQQVAEEKLPANLLFGHATAPAAPVTAKFLRLRFYGAGDQPAAMPCDGIEVY